MLRVLVRWAIAQTEVICGFEVEKPASEDQIQAAAEDSCHDNECPIETINNGQDIQERNVHIDKVTPNVGINAALCELEFDTLLALVRFPFISWEQYDGTFDEQQKLFLCNREMFVTLFTEALTCQMGEKPAGEEAAGRCKARNRNYAIPDVSVSDAAKAMVQFYCKLRLVNPSSASA